MKIYVARNSDGETVGAYKSEEEARRVIIEAETTEVNEKAVLEVLNCGVSSALTDVVARLHLKENILCMVADPEIISTSDFNDIFDCEITKLDLDLDVPRKPTGIIRRVDELGRIVIPKAIRESMKIEEGEPLEIFHDLDEEEVIFKKYTPMEDN